MLPYLINIQNMNRRTQTHTHLYEIKLKCVFLVNNKLILGSVVLRLVLFLVHSSYGVPCLWSALSVLRAHSWLPFLFFLHMVIYVCYSFPTCHMTVLTCCSPSFLPHFLSNLKKLHFSGQGDCISINIREV